ncbi:Rieske (2Fe-2S) protein [Nocardioides pantholopis]|uniref:Rieske (2Fe-2S) protein n=1 Tax=Nocardioides pantholopis TaxID=2483798 RepID=UPI000F08DAA4|nr:Rieske (2Fe-2S) protein [Nocardioides pantholopis]
MTDSHETPCRPCISRRHALTGAATVGLGVPFLAACGGDDTSTATNGGGGGSAGAGGGTTSSGAPQPGAGGLTSAADIPVGGGRVFPDENVVIVQPSAGEFRGWSAMCTHQGCAVSDVEDGDIVCRCHNSTFSIEDGEPTGGPAEKALDEVALTVSGDSISLA